MALKRIVDEDNQKGQFILTGSADVFGLADAGDSLAGRVQTLILRPLSTAEIHQAGPCRLLDLVENHGQRILSALPALKPYKRAEAIDLMVRGGFPEMRTLGDRARISHYQSYIDSIVVKDVPIVAPVRKSDLLRRLVDQLAARTAQELNMAKLCEAVGARKETVSTWLDTLERLCIIQRLPSWASSEARRAVHWPKLHFMDTGCATALRHETPGSFELGADPTALGAILESFLQQEIEKTLPFQSSLWRLAHWRSDSAEIDLIAEGPRRSLALFEVKAATGVSKSDFKSIEWFLRQGPGQAYGEKAVGFVVYLGNDVLSMGPGLIALPFSMLWSFPRPSKE
jgi:predicted AAA+ superfamily ATPase